MKKHFLLILSFALMLTALGLIFIYVPTEKQGNVQRIFYFHVPIA